MIRTQIYLSEAQRRALQALGKKCERPMSALIREAIDAFLNEQTDSTEALEASFGLWRDRPADQARRLREEWEQRRAREVS